VTVTVVLHEATRTGAPRVGALIAAGLAQHEDVRVVVLRDGPLVPWLRDVVGGDRLIVCRTSDFSYQTPFAERVQHAREMLAGDASDLIYVNSVAASPFILAAKSLARRVVLHVHEKAAELLSLLRLDATKLEVVGMADGVVLAADGVAADLEEIFGVSFARRLDFGIVVDVDGIGRLARERVPAPRNAAGRALPARRRYVVGMCGTAAARKGTDIFLETAKAMPELDFVWIGGWSPDEAPDNLSYQDYRALALKNLYVTGAVDNPYAYMNRLDLFFLSSREDPNPLVLAEAAILGIPILAFSEATAVADWLGRSAILCYGPPNMPDAVRVLQAIAADKAAAGRLRGLAVDGADRFDLSTKLDGMLAFLASIRALDTPASIATPLRDAS